MTTPRGLHKHLVSSGIAVTVGIGLVTAGTAALPAAAAVPAKPVTATPLGSFQGTAVNSTGQMVGVDSSGQPAVAIGSASTGYSVTDLPEPSDGFNLGTARSINAHGQIAGWAGKANGEQIEYEPVTWIPTTNGYRVVVLQQTTFGQTAGINDSGTIVGNVSGAIVEWQSSATGYGAATTVAKAGYAEDINNSGEIVAVQPLEVLRRSSPSFTTLPLSGGRCVKPPVPSNPCTPLAINASGSVLASNDYSGYLWSLASDGAYGRPAVVTGTHPKGGGYVYPTGLADDDVVVGALCVPVPGSPPQCRENAGVWVTTAGLTRFFPFAGALSTRVNSAAFAISPNGRYAVGVSAKGNTVWSGVDSLR